MSRNRTKNIAKAAPLDPSIKHQATSKPSGPFSTVGAPGTAIYGGYVVSKEKEAGLQGSERYKTYSNILANTTIVGAGVRLFVNMVAKAKWSAEPADESTEAERLAELVEDIMGDCETPWHRIIRRAAMFCFWGFSIQEWTAKRREDGVVGYLDIEPRAQITIERWDVDVNGHVLGVIQRNPQSQEEIYIPRQKTIYLVDDTLNDSPEGLGTFRNIVKAAKRLERYELLEAWGFETDLRGMPVVRGPFSDMEELVQAGKLTTAQVAALKAPMLTFLQSHNRNPELGMLLDSKTYTTTDERGAPSPVRQWDIELLQGTPTSVAEVAAAIERLNREIARVLGVEQLLLGSTSQGSQALARDKSQQFGLIIDSVIKELKETFEKDFLNPLWELNGWDPKLKPELIVEKVQHRDVEAITTALEQMARAGAIMPVDDPAINAVRELLGLPDQPDIDMVDPDATLAGRTTKPRSEVSTVKDDETPEEDKKLAKVVIRPRAREGQSAFVTRFNKNAKAVLEFPNKKQREAVANQLFQDR